MPEKIIMKLKFSESGTEKLDELMRFWDLESREEVVRFAMKMLSQVTDEFRGKREHALLTIGSLLQIFQPNTKNPLNSNS